MKNFQKYVVQQKKIKKQPSNFIWTSELTSCTKCIIKSLSTLKRLAVQSD